MSCAILVISRICKQSKCLTEAKFTILGIVDELLRGTKIMCIDRLK